MDFNTLLKQKNGTKTMMYVPLFPNQFFEMELNKSAIGDSISISNLDEKYRTIDGHRECFWLRSQKDVDEFFYVTTKKEFIGVYDYIAAKEHYKKNGKKWIFETKTP